MNPQQAKKLEHEIIKKLQVYINKNAAVIAAISGGPDSMFLLHFLKQTSAKIIVANLDHQVRKNSHKDTEFVRRASQNLIFHSKTMDIKKLGQKNKTGIEETGRKERYRFFNQLAKKYRAHFIITAHHADDNLETLLFNFTRGASLQGLSGMPEYESPLLRPLLQFSKKQILDYLKFRKIQYCTDQTNYDTNYSRNFLRQEIIPGLKKLNPNLAQTVSKNTANIREINDFLKESARKFLAENTPHQLDAKSFRSQPPVLQKQILLEAYRNITGETTNISATHLEEILEIINNNIGNKRKKFGKIMMKLEHGKIKMPIAQKKPLL